MRKSDAKRLIHEWRSEAEKERAKSIDGQKKPGHRQYFRGVSETLDCCASELKELLNS